MPKIIHPKDEADWLARRTQDVTSTESAALVGLHPRLTQFELYQRKLGAYVEDFEGSERTKWGLRLQDPIARGVAEDAGIKIRALSAYARHATGARMGASFDYEVVGVLTPTDAAQNPSELARLYDELGPGILEVKNVDGLVYRNDWINDDDGIEAPAYIEVQLQHQLEVIDREWGAIAALVGGNRPIIIARRRDRVVGKSLLDRINVLWAQIEQNTPPDPDFRRDLDVLAKLYGYAEPGKVLDASDNPRLTDLAARHKELGAQIKTLSEDRDALKAEMLTLIGDAEKILLPHGFTISAGMVGPKRIEYDRAGFRDFRINQSRKKAVA